MPLLVLGLALIVAAQGWRRLTGGTGAVAARAGLGLVGLSVVGLALWWCAERTGDNDVFTPTACLQALGAEAAAPAASEPKARADAGAHMRAPAHGLIATVGITASTAAAKSAGAAAAASAPDMGLVSGPETGTYFAMGGNIVDLAARHGLRILHRVTNGSFMNLAMMAGKENAALGFAQADILEVMLNSSNPELRAQALLLRRVLTLHVEEVHVLARASLKGVADLAGRRVLVANNSEGSRYTAENLLRRAGVAAGELDASLSAEHALCQVLTGQADAMVIVAGKPTPLLTKLNALRSHSAHPLVQVRLLPLTGVPAKPTYETAHISDSDYAWLDESAAAKGTVTETLGVRAVLIAYDFSKRLIPYQHLRCDQLSQLTGLITLNLAELQRHPNHLKWQEVALGRRLDGWKDNQCQ